MMTLSARTVQKSAQASRAPTLAGLPLAGLPLAGPVLAAMLLTLVLASAPAHAAGSDSSAADGSRPSAAGTLEPNGSARAVLPRATVVRAASGPEAEALATLGLLALGIGGLIWVRRHVAEL
jgi:hypothetical protein